MHSATRAAKGTRQAPNVIKGLGSCPNPLIKSGGDEGDRTLDLCVANASLSQLSYVPGGIVCEAIVYNPIRWS